MIILQTAHKIGWNVDFWASSPPIRLPLPRRRGRRQKGSTMSPALYRYPDDPRPGVANITARYKQRYGIDINYLGDLCMRRRSA